MPELNAMGIVVSDMGRSIRFYRLLGLDVLETQDAFWGQRYALLIDPDGVRVNLYAPN